jgi:hypothetical protein
MTSGRTSIAGRFPPFSVLPCDIFPTAFQLVQRGGLRVKVRRLFRSAGLSINRDKIMSTEVLIGEGEAARLIAHPLRAAILG